MKLLFDQNRLQKQLDAIQPSLVKNYFLNAPLLDFMAPTLKINQILTAPGTIVDDVNFAKVQKMDRCTTCHLPSANKAPESLEEFPLNAFGDRLRLLGKQLSTAGKPRDISTRLQIVAREDADADGVPNEAELLLGHGPGDSSDKPTKRELASLATRQLQSRPSSMAKLTPA